MPEGYERTFETRTLLTGQSSKQENRGAEGHLEHHPLTLHPGDPGDVAAWDEEEVLRNSPSSRSLLKTHIKVLGAARKLDRRK